VATVNAMCVWSAVALFLVSHPIAWGTPGRRDVERHRLAEVTELLALRPGRFLAWNDRGAAYLRDAEGDWTDRIQLPLAHVWALVPDGPGFLASGELGDRTTTVVLFDAHAHELRRWTPAEPGWDLLVEGPRRWYVRPDGLVELLPDGRIGPLEAVPDRPGIRPRQPHILTDGGARLICYGLDRSEASYARARCRRPGGEYWWFDDQRSVSPVNCGPWVIAHGRRDEQVVVFSFDGRVVGQRIFRGVPVYACGDSETLVIGARRLVQVVKLPSLEPVWTRRLDKGNVVMVAALKGAVAYGTDAASEVLVVRR